MKTRKDTLVRKKEIISAARKLIVKYGSEHITVRRIAKEIGVSEGAIYRHFKSKKEILLLLVDDIDKTLTEDIEKNYSGDLKSLETLGKIFSSHMSAIEQRKGITFQVIAEIISLGDKKLNKRIYDVIEKYLKHIHEILETGVRIGIIRSDIDLGATAKLFFGMTQGLVNIWALNQYNFDIEQEYKPLWNIFLKAVEQPVSRNSSVTAHNNSFIYSTNPHH